MANKLTLVLLFIVLISTGVLLQFSYAHSNKEEFVTISDSGFSKKDITIQKGTTVTWQIDGEKLHWPASDNHPTHALYPDGGGCIGSKLDACNGLKKGETFSFKFEKLGTWTMHDHLSHGNTMAVNVVTNKFFLSIVKSISFGQKNSETCKKYIGGSKEQEECFTKEILREVHDYNATPAKIATLIMDKCNGQNACYAPLFIPITMKKGFEFAFKVTFELRKIDRIIANSCHSVARQIGWATYRMDPKNWQENLRHMDIRCSWGAVHGVVEEYAASTGNKFDKNMIKVLCNGNAPCNHGVGHLLLVQEEGNISKALDICTVLKVWDYRHMCMTGVFMERMAEQNSAEREDDPVGRRIAYSMNRMNEFKSVCDNFTGEPYTACWSELSRPAIVNFNQDPKTVFDYCNKAKTYDAANYCRRRAMLDLVPTHNYDLQGIKYMCELGSEYDKYFQRDCYLRIAVLATVNFPEDKKNEIDKYCLSIQDSFRAACKDIMDGLSLKESIAKNLGS